MKYIKIAILSILGASCLYACQKENTNFGPGTGVVEFGLTDYQVSEMTNLFTIPLVLSGEPGGYPVTVKISAETDGDIDDILLITSTTIKISEDNNSFIQMIPVFNREENADHEVHLTIEECNGASIGDKHTCTIVIKNSAAVHTGQYTVVSSKGMPDEWTLLLQNGPEGTYIASNLFNGDFSPQLVGVFDEEKSQITFDGRLYGQGSTSWFYSIGWGMYNGNYILLYSGRSGTDPVVINVDQDMYLSTSVSSFQILEVDSTTYDVLDTPLGVMEGETTFEYAGAAIEEEWPF